MKDEIAVIREALSGRKRTIDREGGWEYDTPPSMRPVLAALAALTAQMEEMERERDETHQGWINRTNAAEARVEELEGALEVLYGWSSRMPDAGFTAASPRYLWWFERPVAQVRAALAKAADPASTQGAPRRDPQIETLDESAKPNYVVPKDLVERYERALREIAGLTHFAIANGVGQAPVLARAALASDEAGSDLTQDAKSV